MSIESTRFVNVSIFFKKIDVIGEPVDTIDISRKYVDFFNFYRHICHKMRLNCT